MNLRIKTGGAGLAAVLAAAIALLIAAPAALATQSDQYNAFTNCPTDNPALNDPAAEFAICAAGAGQGELKIGDRTIQLQQIGVQFAVTGLGTGEPDCPLENGCFGKVPGSTVVEDQPSAVSVGAPGSGRSNRGKGRALQLKLTVESAGDVSAFTLGAIFGAPVPMYKLPVKVHVEAPWLGDDCYIGSNKNPVLIEPFITGPPAGGDFLEDPNGYHIEEIIVAGLPLADKALAIPPAHGCGHGGAGSDARADALVNDRLDLPSAAGSNEVALPAADLALVAAGFDGTLPDGGAELLAAFEAAR